MRMSNSLWRVFVMTLACGLPRWCIAEDVYAVRFFARSELCPFLILWEDDIVFHNSTTGDKSVRLLAVSNGELRDAAEQLLIPAGRTVSANGKVAWLPRSPVPLWVVHLDVPSGVIVQSRVEVHTDSCGGVPPSPTPELGAFSLPVFRALTPARVRKIHLGADLGSEVSYVNVGIYNAATISASALIELRQGCDDALLEPRNVEIPPNSIVQFAGFHGVPSRCPATQGSWSRYVTVTVDQPSLSYVVNKKSELRFPVSVPYNSPH
jgi:hypothetical protein